MARLLRIEFPGALYHVLGWGNEKKGVFLDDEDRHACLKRIQHYKEEIGFNLYAYVLMPSHIHLLIETNQIPLSKIMLQINLTYTQYFNRKYDRLGHVFQGRYKALLCDRDEYLLALVRYIHLNPVRAHLVEGLRQFRWSSHHEYLNGRAEMTDAEAILKMFSPDLPTARKMYEQFVDEAIGKERTEASYKPLHQQIL